MASQGPRLVEKTRSIEFDRCREPISDCHNPNAGNDEAIHQNRLSHALPTSQAEDPDLAFIVGLWDRLANECKQRLIEIVRENLPS